MVKEAAPDLWRIKMNFVVITDTNNEKVVLNLNNVVSFKVSHPREDCILTTIETTSFGCRYYIDGDITKELWKLMKANNNTLTNLN